MFLSNLSNGCNSSTTDMALKPTVFIIEDNDDLRLSLHWLLEGAGYHARSYGSAEEFLASPDRPQEGCLVLDVCLPGISGIELLRMLNASALKTIVMTAHGDASTEERALQSGAWAYIQKPFDHDILLQQLQAAAR